MKDGLDREAKFFADTLADLSDVVRKASGALGNAVKFISESKAPLPSGDKDAISKELIAELSKFNARLSEEMDSEAELVETIKNLQEKLEAEKKSRSASDNKKLDGEDRLLKAVEGLAEKINGLRDRVSDPSAKLSKVSDGGEEPTKRKSFKSPKSLDPKDMGFKPRGPDTIPAMLSPGEFVVNAKSTKIFEPLLDMMNRGYVKGGKVRPEYLSHGHRAGRLGAARRGGRTGVPPPPRGTRRTGPPTPPPPPLPPPPPTPPPPPLPPPAPAPQNPDDFGRQAAEAFSDELRGGSRKKLAAYFSEMSAVLLGGHMDVFDVLFSGAVRDITNFRKEARSLAFELEGMTSSTRGMQAGFTDMGAVAAQTGQRLDVIQKLYMSNMKKGFKGQGAELKKVLKSGLFLSTMIGSDAGETAEMFSDWNRTLGMSSMKMKQLAADTKNIARNTGVSGGELLRAMKSSEEVLKNLRGQMNLTSGATKNVISAMATAQKLGIEDKAAQTMSMMSSTTKFLKGDGATQRFLMNMGGQVPGGMDKIMGGVAMDDQGLLKDMAKQMDQTIKEITMGRVGGVKDMKNASTDDKRLIAQVLDGMYEMDMHQYKGHFDMLNEAGKDLGDRFSDLTKEINKNKDGTEGFRLAQQKMDDLMIGSSMTFARKLTDVAEDGGISFSDAVSKATANMTETERKDMATLMKKSNLSPELQAKTAGMGAEGDYARALLVASQTMSKRGKDLGMGVKDFSPEIMKAMETKDKGELERIVNEMDEASNAIDVKMKSTNDPINQLTQNINELNETLRKYLGGPIGMLVDTLGWVGLALIGVGAASGTLFAQFGDLGARFGRLTGVLGGLQSGLGSIFDRLSGTRYTLPIGPHPMGPLPLDAFEKTNIFSRMADRFAWFFGKLADMWGGFWGFIGSIPGRIGGVFSNIGSAFSRGLSSLPRMMFNVVGGIVRPLESFVGFLSSMGGRIAAGWSLLPRMIFNVVGGMVRPIELFVGFLRALLNPFRLAQKAFQGLGNVLRKTPIIGWLFMAVDGVIGAVEGYKKAGDIFGVKTNELTQGMKISAGAAGGVVGVLDGLTFGLLRMTGVAGPLTEFLAKLFYGFTYLANGIKEGFMSWMPAIQESFSSLGKALGDLWASFAGIFGYDISSNTKSWESFYDMMKKVGVAVGWLVGAFLKGLVDTITVVVQVVQFFVEAIRKLVEGIGWAVGKVRSWTDYMGLTTPAPATTIPATTIPATTIPAMAEGGVVTGPTTALIGEAGPEAVIPLSKLDSVAGSAAGKDNKVASTDYSKEKTLAAQHKLQKTSEESKKKLSNMDRVMSRGERPGEGLYVHDIYAESILHSVSEGISLLAESLDALMNFMARTSDDPTAKNSLELAKSEAKDQAVLRDMETAKTYEANKLTLTADPQMGSESILMEGAYSAMNKRSPGSREVEAKKEGIKGFKIAPEEEARWKKLEAKVLKGVNPWRNKVNAEEVTPMATTSPSPSAATVPLPPSASPSPSAATVPLPPSASPSPAATAVPLPPSASPSPAATAVPLPPSASPSPAATATGPSAPSAAPPAVKQNKDPEWASMKSTPATSAPVFNPPRSMTPKSMWSAQDHIDDRVERQIKLYGTSSNRDESVAKAKESDKLLESDHLLFANGQSLESSTKEASTRLQEKAMDRFKKDTGGLTKEIDGKISKLKEEDEWDVPALTLGGWTITGQALRRGRVDDRAKKIESLEAQKATLEDGIKSGVAPEKYQDRGILAKPGEGEDPNMIYEHPEVALRTARQEYAQKASEEKEKLSQLKAEYDLRTSPQLKMKHMYPERFGISRGSKEHKALPKSMNLEESKKAEDQIKFKESMIEYLDKQSVDPTMVTREAVGENVWRGLDPDPRKKNAYDSMPKESEVTVEKAIRGGSAVDVGFAKGRAELEARARLSEKLGRNDLAGVEWETEVDSERHVVKAIAKWSKEGHKAALEVGKSMKEAGASAGGPGRSELPAGTIEPSQAAIEATGEAPIRKSLGPGAEESAYRRAKLLATEEITKKLGAQDGLVGGIETVDKKIEEGVMKVKLRWSKEKEQKGIGVGDSNNGTAVEPAQQATAVTLPTTSSGGAVGVTDEEISAGITRYGPNHPFKQRDETIAIALRDSLKQIEMAKKSGSDVDLTNADEAFKAAMDDAVYHQVIKAPTDAHGFEMMFDSDNPEAMSAAEQYLMKLKSKAAKNLQPTSPETAVTPKTTEPRGFGEEKIETKDFDDVRAAEMMAKQSAQDDLARKLGGILTGGVDTKTTVDMENMVVKAVAQLPGARVQEATPKQQEYTAEASAKIMGRTEMAEEAAYELAAHLATEKIEKQLGYRPAGIDIEELDIANGMAGVKATWSKEDERDALDQAAKFNEINASAGGQGRSGIVVPPTTTPEASANEAILDQNIQQTQRLGTVEESAARSLEPGSIYTHDIHLEKLMSGMGDDRISKAAEITAAALETASLQQSTPVGQHAIPVMKEDVAGDVQPVHLRDISESILREKTGNDAGNRKLQSDELVGIEEVSNKQYEEMRQIREGIETMISLLKPSANTVGTEQGSVAKSRSAKRNLTPTVFGQLRNGQPGSGANKAVQKPYK